MYKTRISKNDPDMLKQQIIHYKAEISRYEKLLKEYQENYYYNLIDELRKENEQLNKLVIELQASNKVNASEDIEHQLHLIRDKSIEQLKEMKEENDRLKTEVDNLQMRIKELEKNEVNPKEQPLHQKEIVLQEEKEQSDWFMRTLRERNARDEMVNEENES